MTHITHIFYGIKELTHDHPIRKSWVILEENSQSREQCTLRPYLVSCRYACIAVI